MDEYTLIIADLEPPAKERMKDFVFAPLLQYIRIGGISHQCFLFNVMKFKGRITMAAELLTEYDATLDSKKRFVLRGIPGFNHYHVKVFRDSKNGGYTLKMEPRVLASLDQLSEKTLHMMDSAMKNYAKGIRSKAINTDEMRKIADALPD